MSANFNIVDLLKRKQPRQPWDERLPSGELPFNPFRNLSNRNALGQSAGEAESAASPQQSPSPALQRTGLRVPNNDVLSLLKQSNAAPEPPNEGRQVSTQIPQVRVGTDISQMNPLERQQAKVDLMRSTPAGQKVRQSGDFIEQLPPEQSPSRVKNALVGLLLGTAQGGLPGGIAGAGLGAIKPELVQQMLKEKHLAHEEGQLDSQIEREGKRAAIDYTKGRTEEFKRLPTEKMYAPELRTDANGNLISVQGTTARPVLDQEGKPVKGKVSADGETVAVTIDGQTLNVTPAQALTYFGQIGRQATATTEKDREKQAKREAAQAEYDQLVKDEATAGENKNQAYDYLAKLKANPNVPKEDIAEAAKAAEDANKIYQSFGEKKSAALTRINENTVERASSAQPYAGRTMSAANLARYAKDKGISEDEARRQVEAQGVRVQ